MKFKDSTFLKYIVVAFISFLIDISLFAIFNFILRNIIISTILARVISSYINYLLNREKVFKRGNKTSIYKYYLLVIVQMLISAFGVNSLYDLIKINPIFIKIPVECIIFISNYLIQKIFVFKRNNS